MRLMIIPVICLFFSIPAIGADLITVDGLILNLELEKSVFEHGDDIDLNVTLRNDGSRTMKIYFSENPEDSLVFDLKTISHLDVEKKDDYVRQLKKLKKSGTGHGKQKYILLEPGESFSKLIRISEIYDLPQSAEYILRCSYLPDLNHSKISLNSKPIRFKMRPGEKMRNEIATLQKRKTAIVESDKLLLPQECIRLMNEAKKIGDFETFYKFLDLPVLITSYTTYKEDFLEAQMMYDTEKMNTLISSFKNFLKSSPPELISGQEILRTEIIRNRATVEAILEFKTRAEKLILKRKYIYQLSKSGNYWKVSDYQVINLN